MRTFEGLEGITPARFASPVATIGTFDGLHIGHKAVISDLVAWADAIGGDPVVITFRRHPRLVLSGEAPARITSFEERLAGLESLGVTSVVVLRFTPQVASTPPRDFVRKVLIESIGIRGVVLGFGA
ncbi:MAG: bifunctional riboflavin kinase/FAD synthetase, partial [Planctomycetota bacterium]